MGDIPHEWYVWGESAAKTGFTGVTSKAGYPDSYTYTGDTIKLRNIGKPYIIGGFTMGVTKTGGGRIKGNKSHGTEYQYFPGIRNMDIAAAFNLPPKPYDREETLTGEADSATVNEVTLLAALVAYGNLHKYPRSFVDILGMLPGNPQKIHTPQCSVTSAGAITPGSGSVTLDSASQEDLWIKSDSVYYILGAIPHLVNNNGLLQFVKNLPYNESQSNLLPLGLGADPVNFGSSPPSFPYEPIGPFSMGSPPSVGLYSTGAAATTFSLIIAEM